MKRSKSISWLWLWVSVLCGVAALSGCTFIKELASGQNPLATTTPTLPPAPTATPTITPSPTPTTAPRAITLALWVPEIISPTQSSGSPDILAQQLARFAARTPGVRVRVDVKLDTGAGGIANLLTTAKAVAPAVLPDVIVLNQHDLLSLGEAGLVQPLQDDIPSDAGYFTRALASVSSKDAVWAFPYVADADQLAYREAISTTPPLSWTTVLTHNLSMLFPAAPADGLASDALLSIYLGSGGRVADASGQATLDRAVLERVYGFFADMQQTELLDADLALTLPNAVSCWQLYLEGQGQFTPVPMSTYWLATPEDTLPGWVPTPDGEPITVLKTWGLAVVTDDPVRRAAALELIRWLVSVDNMAELSAAEQLLPTRSPAVAIWAGSQEGSDFIDELMNSSVSALPPSVDTLVRRALQAGLTALLQRDVNSPEAAASAALTNLRR